MDTWEKFVTSSWAKEFVAGGLGGTTGVVAGYPLDTLRIRQQQSNKRSAISIFRCILANGGPSALYRGMGAPLGSVAFQNAIVFKSYATLSRAFNTNAHTSDPPSYAGVALGGTGAGIIQSVVISPIELVKIRLQRGFTITVLRDGPSHGVYFWTYEYMREKLHPGCRKTGEESFTTMLIAGGLAGVTSWICCYPLDVIKTRIQAHSNTSQLKSMGIRECLKRSVKDSSVLWRGLGTTITRAFIVNGMTFTAYETVLKCLDKNDHSCTNSSGT